MARRLKISEARGKLPELAKFLSRHPDKTVVLEHRDLDERLVLTTERYLRYLETAVKELKKRSARRFKLAGSVTSQLSDAELEAALQAMRDEAAKKDERRFHEFAK